MSASHCAADAMKALLSSLGDRAKMLDYLPYDQVVFQEQHEIPLAIPKAILFGTMKRKGTTAQKPLVWVYLCRDSPSLVFHTYYPSGRPDGILIHDEVIQKATSNEAFQFATTPMRLLVLATYYFMKDGVETTYDITMSKAYEVMLESICEDFRRAKRVIEPLAKCSKVVKLRVRVPVALFPDEAKDHAQKTLNDGRHQSNDSGIDDMTRESRVTTMKAPVVEPLTPMAPATPTSHTPPIDRYLELEDQESFIHEGMEAFEGRISDLKQRLESMAKELQHEEDGAKALITRKDSEESEKKRLWDAMSKEDIRELGRRDAQRKRQKL